MSDSLQCTLNVCTFSFITALHHLSLIRSCYYCISLIEILSFFDNLYKNEHQYSGGSQLMRHLSKAFCPLQSHYFQQLEWLCKVSCLDLSVDSVSNTVIWMVCCNTVPAGIQFTPALLTVLCCSTLTSALAYPRYI